MCRYAMKSYKPHYACFECRKTFKRRLMWDIRRDDNSLVEAKCPECGALMASMGYDFESPKKDDIKAWQHIKDLYSVGITFHSCGCTGPGYIPRSKERLIAWFEEILLEYTSNLTFWRQRVEPTNQKEIQRESSKHGDEIIKIPYKSRPDRRPISNEEAKQYWFDRINEVKKKLDVIKNNM